MNKIELSPERKSSFCSGLTKVETLERYLRKPFMGQKTFSIEGLDVMVPMLEEMIDDAGRRRHANAVLGMAHRGRLNVIAHVVNLPYEELLGRVRSRAVSRRTRRRRRDRRREVPPRRDRRLRHADRQEDRRDARQQSEPSRSGRRRRRRAARARCRPIIRSGDPDATMRKSAAPILIHGDAAFAGQGIVAEVLQPAVAARLRRPAARSTSSRTTRSASPPIRCDGALDALCVGLGQGLRRADRARQRRRRRRVHRGRAPRGRLPPQVRPRRAHRPDRLSPLRPQRAGRAGVHAAADVRAIKSHPTVRELFAEQAGRAGRADAPSKSTEMADAATARCTKRARRSRNAMAGQADRAQTRRQQHVRRYRARAGVSATAAGVERCDRRRARRLRARTRSCSRSSSAARRRSRSKGDVDWGTGRSARVRVAALLGHADPPHRQDTERGTFSHRHAVLHDPSDDAKTWIPLQHLSASQASFEIHNCPLSEYACLGFEYGYSAQEPDALVLWEAQFGDFINGAQIIIDQFIAAGAAKWGQNDAPDAAAAARLRRRGPEHSSARLERFSAALGRRQHSRRVSARPPRNYFHLLRMQARSPMPCRWSS